MLAGLLPRIARQRAAPVALRPLPTWEASMSSQLSGIEFTLRHLLQGAVGLRLELLAKGKTPKPGDADTPAFFGKLDDIGRRVTLVMRNLKSMEHGQFLRADRLPSLPREARWGEQQSINSQLENIRRVRALALQLFNEVRGIYAAAMTPTRADVIEGANDILGELGKHIDQAQLHATVHHAGDGPVFTNASLPGGSAVSASDVLTQVWLLLSCVVAMTRPRKR